MLHVALSTSAAGLLVFCLAVLMLTPLVVVEALAHRRRRRARAAGPAPITLIGGSTSALHRLHGFDRAAFGSVLARSNGGRR